MFKNHKSSLKIKIGEKIKMKKTALIIIVITIISKIFGFTREILLSYFYGASNISDVYIVSTTIPNVIYGFVVAGITASYIPVLSKIKNDEGNDEANSFTSNLVNIVILITTLMALIISLFAPAIVKAFASGFDATTFKFAVMFTRITLFSMYSIGLTVVFSGYLQVEGRYVITSIYMSKKIGLILLPLGYVAANIVQLILLLPAVSKIKYKHRLIINFKNEYIIEVVRMSIPVIIGISVNQVNVLIDRTLASRIIEGGISALSYANTLTGFIIGIFVLSITTVIYPTISKLASESKIEPLVKVLSQGIISIAVFVIPATVGFILFSEPIVRLLYGRGEFSNDAVSLTAQSLSFYSIGIMAVGLRELFARVYYAFHETLAAIGMIINIVLNIILSRVLGIGGLALATSISAIISSYLMVISLKKRFHEHQFKIFSSSLFKIFLSSLLMGIVSYFSFNYLMMSNENTVSLFITILIAFLTYFGVMYLLKVEEFNAMLGHIKNKVKKN